MADKKLNIKVGLKGAKKAEQGLGKVNSSMKSMAKTALVAGGSFFAVQGIIRGFSAVIKLAGEQQKAEKKLETALGGVNHLLLKQASALQKVSSHGDETIIGMMALASNMGIAEEQLEEATKMAIGLSEALGVDLNMAMKAAAGAIQGDTNMLTRYIPLLKVTESHTEKLAIVQEVANKGMKQAEANTDTLTGSMEQAEMAIGDAGEALGKTFAPAIIDVSNWVQTVAEDLGYLMDEMNRAKSVNVAYYEEFEKAEEFITKYSESLGIAIDPTLELTDQIEVLRAGAEEIQESEFLKGVAFSESARAIRDTRDTVAHLTVALEEFRASALPLADKPLINLFDEDDIAILPDVMVDMQELDDMFDETFGKEKTGIISESFSNISGAIGDAMSNTSNLLANLAGEDKERQIKAMRLAQLGAVVSTAGGIAKALEQSGVLGLITGVAVGVAGAAQVAAIEGAINDAQAFAQGGIVQGQGTGDTVPAMLTPGEVILNQAQQSNLVGGMGGVTINVSAPLVDETILDTIIPAIEKAHRMNLA